MGGSPELTLSQDGGRREVGSGVATHQIVPNSVPMSYRQTVPWPLDKLCDDSRASESGRGLGQRPQLTALCSSLLLSLAQFRHVQTFNS